MNTIQKKILNKLLDGYEQSKTFIGENKVKQSFSVRVGQMFPKYMDDAEYDFFCEINTSLKELEVQKLVTLEKSPKGVYDKVFLVIDQIPKCYAFLKRVPRREEQEWLQSVWEQFQGKGVLLEPLGKYIGVQKEKKAKNRNIEYYDQNHKDYEDLLLLAIAVLENEEEIFIRDISMKIFGNSKRAEQLQSKLQSLLFQYGDFEEKESVLEECGVVHTPTYVMIKGNGKLWLNEQVLDLSELKGDIALSTASLKELKKIEVLGRRIVTIENLTSFHDYPNAGDFVIYLGGFHNKVKRNFMMKLFASYKDREYCHFGDIDAGGFYILEHLKQKTGIPFRSLKMDVETLMTYQDKTMTLTVNDRTRLEKLLSMLNKQAEDGQLLEDYREVIRYMLEKNCKLEQEAVGVE